MGGPFVIGYAVLAKKACDLVYPGLVQQLKDCNIDLIPIDRSLPLEDQGRLDVLIHRFWDEEWCKVLADYLQKNPHVFVIDSPAAILRLQDRGSLLKPVENLRLKGQEARFEVPTQCIVESKQGLLDLAKTGEIKFPLIAKPLVTDGHKMCLVFNQQGLEETDPPILLQEFVNHGGVVFKIYVVGNSVSCVQRKSLPDVSEEDISRYGNSVPFARISNAPATESDVKVENPPEQLVREVAKGLRSVLELNLFNVDVIRDARDQDKYYILDFNYMPAFHNLPEYENMLLNFYLDLAAHKISRTEKLC